MRLIDSGKSVLIASIPGAVLPIAFFLLFSFKTTATLRDVSPALNNLLKGVGAFGFVIFSIPISIAMIGFIIFVITLHEHGFAIPFFDSLTQEQQIGVALTIALICNVLLWAMLISYWRPHKRDVATQADLSIGENQTLTDED